MHDWKSILPEPLDGILPGVMRGSVCQAGGSHSFAAKSPIDGQPTLDVWTATADDVKSVVEAAHESFLSWQTVPAPVRGHLVREIGEWVRANKQPLAEIVCLESGKIMPEALGEIQEWIDVCDFAVGLSRQLYGKTIASERPEHFLIEQWHPLGVVGVISAFNFPAAVWAWNAMIALVCGDTVVWKPSEQTPLTALACHQAVVAATEKISAEIGSLPDCLSSVVIGGADVGAALASNPMVPLVSATGSIPMGRKVAATVGSRLGRSLLELGGNNAMIVAPSADLKLAVRAIVFSAVGTCGQRCTSLRRLIVHRSLASDLIARLKSAYATLAIGDPRLPGTLVGPLVGPNSWTAMQQAIADAESQGGTLVCGGKRATGVGDGAYVEPAIIHMPAQTDVMLRETFAPVLYVVEYDKLDEAIAIHNDVPQGLSSAIFTGDAREAMSFIGPAGSDCGLANVNIGTSGAEIGGAFGGEKQTGGGRESGSDSWKQYMRRTTCTINYGTALPLAQGIEFG